MPNKHLPCKLKGRHLLNTPELNKDTAFSKAERDEYELHGLLPAVITSQRTQIVRALENLHRKNNDIERYIFLMALLGRNERLFYKMLIENIVELMPLIYTQLWDRHVRNLHISFVRHGGFM